MNNGRCPYCGKSIENKPIDYHYKSKDLTYHICSKCSKKLLRNKTIGIILNIFGLYLIICLVYFNFINDFDISPIHLLAIYVLVHGGNKLRKDDINRAAPIWKKILVYAIEILVAFFLASLIVVFIKNNEIAKWIFVILIFSFSKIFPPSKFFHSNRKTHLQENKSCDVTTYYKGYPSEINQKKHKLSIYQILMIGLSIALCIVSFIFIINRSSEWKLKRTAINYVKEISPNADVEITKIINDTILPFYLDWHLDSKQSSIDMTLMLSSFNRNNKNRNYNEIIEDWNKFCAEVKDFQNEKNLYFKTKKHLVFLKSNNKKKVQTYYKILIIDDQRINTVEHQYYFGQEFYKDLLHKVIYLKIPIDLYDKGQFNRKDYIRWLKDNESEIINTTDSIYNIIENNFRN